MRRILLDKSNLSAFAGMCNHAIADRIAAGQEIGLGIVADTEDGESIPAGVLSFYVDEPFIRITWVYVVPQWRKTGFATELLRTAIDGYLYDEDSEVTSVIAFYPDDTALDALFTACGFALSAQKGSGIIKTTVADCLAVSLIGTRTSSCVVQLSQLPTALITDLLLDNPIMPATLEQNPTKWKDCYLPCSRIYVANNKIKGLLLFSMKGDNIYLEYAYSEKPETLALPYLIESARIELAESYPPETTVCIATTDAATAAIAAKLLPNRQATGIRIAELDFDILLQEIAQYISE